MIKLLAALALAAMTLSIAGAAAALNPQPLPPRCVAGAHCGRPTAHMTRRHRGIQLHCRIVRHHRVCRR